ncbi:hypothetical protein AYO20_09686 [Fonsecaea nubica]|uniref:Major facilitator superfamily (MFS) profile domain-containing protein n=1 Tax=Fonsecaea nubica TaxID=856822 RepID=A0A178CFL7_9EURO|nr:hypothetical protein AYO20_09686 [Fonsecaea nubica]OAL27833.1 hypothetical protein AYO20_09686 [Fonsecaea nubica]
MSQTATKEILVAHEEEHVGGESPAENQGAQPDHRIVKAYEGDGPEPAITLKTWLALTALMFHYSTHSALISICGPIITYINADLAKTVATGIAALIIGTTTDLLGRRWVTIGGSILGVIGCILGATAQSVPQVIAAMAVNGIGGGASLNTFACMAEIVSRKQRGLVFSIMYFMTSCFVIAGSLIGHAMLRTAAGWRTLFYLLIAMNALTTVLGYLFYRPGPPLALQTTTRRQIIKDFDYVGLFGVTAGPVLLLIAIIWLGGAYPFNSPQVLSTFIIGLVLIFALAVYEVYVPKNPLLHPFLFKEVRKFVTLLVVTFTSGMLYYSLLTFLSQYLSLGYTGSNPIRVGVLQIPFGVGTTIGGIGIGLVFRWLRHQRVALLLSIVVQTLFIGLLAVPGPSNLAMALAFICMSGIGIGVEQVITILMVQLALPEEWIGFASGSLTAFRLLGGSVGTAMYITIFRREVPKHVPQAIARAATEAGVSSGSIPDLVTKLLTGQGPELTSIPGVNAENLVPITKALRAGYLDSFHIVWYVAVGLGVLTLICAAFQAELSSQVDNTVAQKIGDEEIKTTDGSKGFGLH